MTSVILTLLAIIALLAFAFFKTKAEGKRNRQQFMKDGKRRTFKDFERERRETQKRFEEDRFYELGGYGVTRAKNRGENFFKPSGEFSDERITNDPRGIFGESAMAAMVARVCDTDKRKYILMRNLYIPNRGGTTEIDALLLHESGIYVLESKNIAGEISGTLEMERWNQHLTERTEHTFHNPIQQNDGHIRALQHFLKENYARRDLNVDETPIFSVIVFSDRCVLKRIPAKGKNWIICHMFQLQEKFAPIMRANKTFFDTKQLEDFYWKLEPCMHPSERVKASHKAYVQNKARF